MKLESFGEFAVLVRDLPNPIGFANHLNVEPLQGLVEAVPAYETVGLYFAEPQDLEALECILERLSVDPDLPRGRFLEIECTYDGPDLADVAETLSLSQAEVVDIHSSQEYRCYAVGFTPGFAYLGYLDGRLVLPRRAEPRVRVPAGSLAIAGRQTAIYPSESPGGWWLIGSTQTRIVDLDEGYFAIEAGDTVRFVPV